MKKSILLLFAALLPLMASAEKVEIDGIWYNLTAGTKQAEVTYEGNHYDSYYNDYSGSITLPATVTYNGTQYSVTSIGDYAFNYCYSLTAITIPEGVTSIGSSAFDHCSSLTAITIPEGVTSIGNYAFSGCSSLTAITIPEGVTSIGNGVFADCSSLTSINIPARVTSIGNYAFYGCSSLTAITIPENSQLTSIGSSAFYECSSLKTVFNYSDLPLERGSSDYGYVAYYADRVIDLDELIGDYAFQTKEGVHYLVGYIGNDTELTLPTDYKGENYQIGNSAFSGCSSITAITLPESVTSIGYGAFEGCSQLFSLHIGSNVDSYGDKVFEGCNAIKELTVMGSIMPEIPSENLTSITLYSPIPLETKEFAAKVYRNATLNIPNGALTRYQNSDVWKNFWYINEFDPKKGKDICLTINQADNGEVGIVVDLGRTYKVRITAFEGWEIHSVTFNGKEVTDQLTEEGTFTTPALSEDAVLNIAYEKSGDNAIEKARASAIKVQGHQGTLRITGANEGTDISVYTTDGMLVTRESAEASETEITLPTGEVYIVTVADKMVKIGM